MKNNTEMEGPKYKKKSIKKEEKKSRKGHVAFRKEEGSFLLFKIRLRVIHKKKKKGKRREKRREEEEEKRRKKERKRRSQVCKLGVYGTC